MLTKVGCQARRARFWDALDDSLEWALLGDPGHLMYFANYYADPFVFRTANAAAVLVLTRNGHSILVTDSMVQRYAEMAHVDQIVAPIWYDGKHSAAARGPKLVESVLAAIRDIPGNVVGLESARLPAGILEGLMASRPGLTMQAVDSVIHQLKRRKDPDELALMRESISAIEAGFVAARQDIRTGMTELDAFHIVERASRESLGRQMPVYGDFVSGPNTTHGGAPSLRRIEQGDIYLLDYSVVVYGYRGDFAATWVVDGIPNSTQRKFRDACHTAMLAGESLLRDGTPCRDVDRAIRASFASAGLEENFRSHSGHGLGLGHPDPPYIVPDSDDILMEGDIVTLEPSQSIAGLGTIRIENNYRITADGFEQLTNHSLELEAEQEQIQES